MKKEYILFDLDGTLTDSSPGIINSLLYAFDKLDFKIKDREELRVFIGPPLIDMMIEQYGFSREKATLGLKFYREYFRDKGIFENSVYDGIPEMLCDLQKRGYKLLLATSKPEEFAKRIMAHFDLEKFFYFIGGSDMGETRNSKSAVIEYVMENCGITEPQKCIMVGDREHDVVGAGKFGIQTVGVLYGYGSREEFEKSGAAYIVETVDELGELLRRM